MNLSVMFAAFTTFAVADDLVPDTSSWKGIVMFVLLFLMQVYREWKAGHDKREVKGELAVAVEKTKADTSEIKEKLDVVAVQTNGQLDALKARAAAAEKQAEDAVTLMEGLLSKIHKAAAGEKFDPAATVIRKAEDIVAAKAAGDSQAIPIIPLTKPEHPG